VADTRLTPPPRRISSFRVPSFAAAIVRTPVSAESLAAFLPLFGKTFAAVVLTPVSAQASPHNLSGAGQIQYGLRADTCLRSSLAASSFACSIF